MFKTQIRLRAHESHTTTMPRIIPSAGGDCRTTLLAIGCPSSLEASKLKLSSAPVQEKCEFITGSCNVADWLASGDELAPALWGEVPCWGLKRHLRAKHGFPAWLQRLVRDGACLEDEDEVTAPAGLQLVLSIDANNEQQKLEAGEELVLLRCPERLC